MTVVFLPTLEPNTPLTYVHTTGEDIAAKSLVCKSEADHTILLASNTDWTRMPAFGVAVQSRVKGQAIEVVTFGEAENLQRDADFNFDDLVFVGVNGKATRAPLAPPKIVQSIGRAKNASDVILLINQTAVEID
jgi:hypothetical protein